MLIILYHPTFPTLTLLLWPLQNQETAGNFTLILPYLEQQNVYNMINFNLAGLDQKNVPPAVGGTGGLFPGVGQNSAYSL